MECIYYRDKKSILAVKEALQSVQEFGNDINLNISDRMFRQGTILEMAIEYKRLRIASMIINMAGTQIKITYRHIHQASYGKCPSILRLLLKKKDMINFGNNSIFDVSDYDKGRTGLMYAVKNSDYETAGLLVVYGVSDVDRKNSGGHSSLDLAIRKDDYKMCELLVAGGAKRCKPLRKSSPEIKTLMNTHLSLRALCQWVLWFETIK